MTKDAAYILFTRLSLAEDEEALAGLHNIYFYRLYKLACSIVGDRGAAEEITNDVFLRVIASAESDSHRAALALTRQQRDFIEKRNASFGKRGYDLRVAMEARLKALTGVDGY